MAILRLDEFEEKWGDKSPPIAQLWRRNWDKVIPFSPIQRWSGRSSTPPTPLRQAPEKRRAP